jgi:hypothetical protein
VGHHDATIWADLCLRDDKPTRAESRDEPPHIGLPKVAGWSTHTIIPFKLSCLLCLMGSPEIYVSVSNTAMCLGLEQVEFLRTTLISQFFRGMVAVEGQILC